MIQFTKMACFVQVGLNFYRAPGGFVAIWAWCDAKNYRMTHRRIRLRLHMWPFILTSRESYFVVERWLDRNFYVAVPRTVAEDEGKHFEVLAAAFKREGFPSSLNGKTLS